MDVTEAIRTLKQRRASLRGSKLIKILESLGFEVIAGSGGPGHRVVKHDGLTDFIGSDFNCPGGRTNAELKPIYVKKMQKLLEDFEQELVALQEEQND